MLASDDDILAQAESWRQAGRGVAIATVIETWGSAPRPVGSHLVIDDQGNFLGSVSGGCVEGDVVTLKDEDVSLVCCAYKRVRLSALPTKAKEAMACLAFITVP